LANFGVYKQSRKWQAVEAPILYSWLILVHFGAGGAINVGQLATTVILKWCSEVDLEQSKRWHFTWCLNKAKYKAILCGVLRITPTAHLTK